ncbi:MAG: choice-of-anchor B family protein [Bacteroidetes bacterium]|nr:choice-of-anchor B family protein [Bacteroidota bacterium]
MKKLLLASLFFILASAFLHAQNVNVTLASTYTYSTGTIANICGWKSPSTGKEYALVGAHTGLSIVDVTNPSSPVQAAFVAGPSCLWREIKTYRNYAYVTSECGTVGLQIVDMTNLPAVSTASWAPTINATKLQTIHALHIDTAKGKVYLFGSNVGNQGAIIADIKTNPMAPVYKGSYDNRYIHDGYARNDTLYACHIYQGDCEVVNCTNPAAGVSLADWNTPNNFTHNSWLNASSKAIFTTDETANSFLTSYDLSNLSNVVELDRIQSNPGSNSDVHNTQIMQKNGGEYAVTSWYNDGFTIVDVTRPNNMVQVGNYDTAPTVSGSGEDHDWGVYPFLPSGTIVASDMENGLFVCSPTYLRACYLEGMVTDCNTGNPIVNATVTITNPPAANINSATDFTDALGKYGVGVLPAGTYTVVVSKQAYTSQTFTVSLTSGNVTTLNVQLCATTPPFPYSGHVCDNATSNGIAGVHVHMVDNTIVWDTITDVNGNFNFPSFLAGTYDIIVGEWGYITKCLSGQGINATSNPLNICLDKGIYDDFSFDFGWVVSGTCVNAWVRDVPIGTYDTGNGNATANPDKDVQNDCSDQCYVTDNGGGAAYDHDVDPPGYTILTSPVFDPTAMTMPVVSYSRWWYDAMLNSNPPNDTMEVYITNGTNTVLLERLLKGNSSSVWVNKKFVISNYVTPTATTKIWMRTSDASPGSIVEGGMDLFYVYDSAAVGVSEPTFSADVKVYPNPSADKKFTVSCFGFQVEEIEVYNVFGEKVYSAIQPSNHSIITISLPLGTGSGIYFYKLISADGKVRTGKLMIE